LVVLHETSILVCCILTTLHRKMKADLKCEVRDWRSWSSTQRGTAKPRICS